MVPIVFKEGTELPFWLQLVPEPPGKLCAEMFQFAPLLISVIVSFAEVSVHDADPSIVCDDVVAMVTTGVGPVVLAFFII